MRNEYLLVGAGLFNAVLAHELKAAGKKVRVIEERPDVGGTCRTSEYHGIIVHECGPHIFHTNDGGVWDFVRKFGRFHRFTYSPKALHNGQVYSLPMNMHTMHEVWGDACRTPAQAAAIIHEQTRRWENAVAHNVRLMALKTIGPMLYELLIRDYTTKMWGCDPSNVPFEVLRRIPVRFTWDNDYFGEAFEGIPDEGYTVIIQRMLYGVPKEQGTFTQRDYSASYKAIVYTGSVDRYWNHDLGVLPYRTLYITSHEAGSDEMGVAAVNHTDSTCQYTRTVQHELLDPHMNAWNKRSSYVTHETPARWRPERGEQIEMGPLYPMRGMENAEPLYELYRQKCEAHPNLYLKGRLGEYRYLNMDQVVRKALDFAKELLTSNPRRKA